MGWGISLPGRQDLFCCSLSVTQPLDIKSQTRLVLQSPAGRKTILLILRGMGLKKPQAGPCTPDPACMPSHHRIASHRTAQTVRSKHSEARSPSNPTPVHVPPSPSIRPPRIPNMQSEGMTRKLLRKYAV
ncbi:hypothetical protein P171DRAFT_235559 [Karstenula rhodostoma CBS 690.94]|uniref:Uncharacterized protein n=1 Tax=Karstenula rhodostoma CBS 690.94 TaxID=1392251 RepID=A0A9P4UFY1_9PLEO|nr:hypothetical protein P171DRAFT_235559 [Karstenula rhodostoma CBS 690.94]